MNIDQALPTFLAESRELLQDMEDALLRLEQQPDDTEAINAAFRAAHTIKGSAGLFGLEAIVAFTHALESVLDRLRANTLTVNEELIALLLACGDHLGQQLDQVGTGEVLDAELQEQGATLRKQLHACAGQPEPPAGGLLVAQSEAV
ncbi:MAG: Hpt domain-containing protein, partial [Gammaproteobacteria bacterium]